MTARPPFRLGLTGSIGMGKSTAAGMFRELGVPVWDADAAVARAYGKGGAGVAAIRAIRPDAIRGGAVDREALKAWIAEDPGALKRIEAAIHPLVAADRGAFTAEAERRGEAIVVFDIPLLFETGADAGMDGTVVVTAPPEAQRARVLARPGMTEEMLDLVLARQMPDSEKRARATWLIPSVEMDKTRARIAALVAELRERHA